MGCFPIRVYEFLSPIGKRNRATILQGKLSEKDDTSEERKLVAFTVAMDSSSANSAELQRLISQEKERAMVNEMVAKLTSACWDKCITGSPGSKFSSSESTCLNNCAQRYLEMGLIIMQRFQSMQ